MQVGAMDQQPRKGLTLIQIMLLVALLGLVLTIAASIWQGPPGRDTPDVEAEQENGSAGTQ